MFLKRSQPLAALAAFRPNISRLRYGWMKWPSSIWIGLLLSCGIPGPQSSVDEISGLERKTVAANAPGLEDISMLTAGDPDGQQVVFVHGTPGSAEGWADFLLAVPPGFQYIAMDRPGFGKSGPKDAVTAIEDQARSVGQLLEIRSGRKPILVGHSLGGAIVAWLAATQPGAVSGLVIAAGSLDPSLEKIHPLQRVGASRPVRSLLPRAVRNANAELMVLKNELQALQPLLAHVNVPIIIVHGTEDDLVPYQNVDYMQDYLTESSNMEVMRLEGYNHFLPWKAKDHLEVAILKMAKATASHESDEADDGVR